MVRKLLQNTTLLFISNLFTKATTALLFILIVRRLGPAAGGVFTLGVTYSLLIMLPLVGLEDFLVRELARNRNNTGKYLTNFVVIRLVTSLILYLVLTVFLTYFSIYPPRTVNLILIIALSALSEGLFATGQSIFFAHEKFIYPVIVSFLTMLIKTFGGVAAMAWGNGFESMILIYLAGSWLGAGLLLLGGIRLAWSVGGPWQVDLRFCLRIIMASISFILMGVLIGLELQLDVILLSLLTGETVVGWYRAATTIFITLALLPTAYRIAIFPLMTRLALESREHLLRLYEKSIYYILFFSLPLVVGIDITAPALLGLIYKEGFEPSIPIIQILIWGLIFLFINVPNTRLLLVLDLQAWIPRFLLLSLLLNISLNLVLMPHLQGVGAAIARLISTGSYTLITFIVIRRRLLADINLPSLKLIPRVILATIIMGIVLLLVINLPLLVLIIVGVGVYLFVAFFAGTIPLDDRRILQKFMPQSLN